MKNKNLIFSVAALVLFAVLAIIYCSPVLSGDSVLQPDIINYKGSAQEMKTFEQETGENVYWSNAMFGGMPTYQTGAQYKYDLIKEIDHTLRFLPRPADYIFLLFGGFFLLGMVLFKKWKYALAGAVFFAMTAYFYIIIGAGHNAKVHAIAYFAPLTAGIILLFRKKYIPGFLLTALFLGLELSANHPQMTYYLFLVLLVYFIFEAVQAFKSKEIKGFATSTILLIFAGIIGVGLNSTRFLSTWEYSKETTRGKSDITLLQSNNEGLNHDYITSWSYGKLETFNLFIPDFMGGASQPDENNLGNYIKEIQAQQHLLDMENEFNQDFLSYIASGGISTYWGDQPGTSGPAYQGAVVVLLFFLGLFLVRGKWKKYKWWLLTATILSIVLAWGKNFAGLTNFMIDYFPFYDKFRAVSSMLVMAEFTMPLLAALTLFVFLTDETLTEEYKKKILTYAGGGVVALLILFYFAGGSLFSFQSSMDVLEKKQNLELVQEYSPDSYGSWSGVLDNLEKAIKKDRIAMFKADTGRTLLFVALTLGLMWLFLLKRIKTKVAVVLGIAGLALVDGWQIDKRYLNDENFVDKMFVDNPFPTRPSNKLLEGAQKNPNILRIASKLPFNAALDSIKNADKSQYRVFDGVNSTFNDATASYFVHSIGGYHGAKLRNYQDIIDLYLSASSQARRMGASEENLEKILDLLNTKYIVVGDSSEPEIHVNEGAFGNVWLTSEIAEAADANEEILLLKDVDLKNQVILNKNTVSELNIKPQADSLSSIALKSYAPDKLIYEANIQSSKIAVFSEIYYPHGWKIKVDGKDREILKADYFLRGVPLEKGDKEIIMEFDPQIIKTGNTMTLAFNALFILLVLGGGFWWWKNRDKDLTELGEE